MPEQSPDNAPDPDPQSSWQFKAGDESADQATPKSKPAHSSVSWTASEFVDHDKNIGWYLTLTVVVVVLAGLVFWLTRDEITTGIIVIVGVFFGIVAGRKPRELPYVVSDQGLQIGPKQYPYNAFRSFAIVEEGAVESIWLMPLRRFMPILTIYFEPNDGEKIVDVLSQYLPIENHKLDPVDKLMHKLRY